MRKTLVLIILGLVAVGTWAYSWSMGDGRSTMVDSFAPDGLPQTPERQKIVSELEAVSPIVSPDDRARILREMGQ